MKEEFIRKRKRGRPTKRWQGVIREDTTQVYPWQRQNNMRKTDWDGERKLASGWSLSM